MNDQIVALPLLDAVWDPDTNPQPAQSVEVARNPTEVAYLTTGDDLVGWPGSTRLIGRWATGSGENLSAIDPAYADWIAEFGNDGDAATAQKHTTRWAGHNEHKYYEYDDTDPENILVEDYPASNRPFTLRITREHITDDGFPHIPWGWRVDMLSADPLRDITARAIGVYSDPAWLNFLFTTGAFIDSGGGNYFTQCPVGQRTANPEDIHFALLLGAAQEGGWSLLDQSIGATQDRLFWST